MLNGEPEYRRRIRNDAEQNQKYADREWDEATQKDRNKEVIAAIESIEKQLECAVDEQTPKNKSDRRRHLAEIVGLWVAAFVGVAAIMQSCHDSNEQRGVMQNQLDEMKNQRLITIAQTRATLVLVSPTTNPHFEAAPSQPPSRRFTGWDLNPAYTNTGATDAIDFRAWFYVRVLDAKSPFQATAEDCPDTSNPPSPGPHPTVLQRQGNRILNARFVSLDEAQRSAANRALITVGGHVEYKDIYYPQTIVHHEDWCLAMIPVNISANEWSFPIIVDKID